VGDEVVRRVAVDAERVVEALVALDELLNGDRVDVREPRQCGVEVVGAVDADRARCRVRGARF
jgi:hypothetical protein